MGTFPDLVACVVELAAINHVHLERSQGHRAHALFLRLIETVDPDLAERLHAPALIKPWTITPLPQKAHQVQHGGLYPLRVAFLQSALYAPFARAFLNQPQQTLRLGEGAFSLRAIDTTSSPWAGFSTWTDVLDRARPAEEITLHFGAPTVITQASGEDGRKRFGLFPDGEQIFRALLRRWNAFAPVQLSEASICDAVEILPKQYSLRTEMLMMAKTRQVGFVGTITYKITGAEASRCQLSALADAALYLGVGAKTTQGMGLVRRIDPSRR